jgi:hypothetical protein
MPEGGKSSTMNDQRNPPPGLSGRQRVGIFLFALGVFPLSYGFRVVPSDLYYIWPIPLFGGLLMVIGLVMLFLRRQ